MEFFSNIRNILWLIPLLPLVAALVSFALPREKQPLSPWLAIGSLGISFLLSLTALLAVLLKPTTATISPTAGVTWFEMGWETVKISWLLNPMTAAMLVMVTFVGLLIFIFSLGYMEEDERKGRFFSYLSFFAASMLGIVISNSLLILFISWELVGLASYLLIGFWYQKPSAAAAAQKAFVVTRLGDVGFFIALLWLYAQTGTLLLYDGGFGLLEKSALNSMTTQLFLGIPVAGAIALLIFCGAAGKSGQFPLHVWLPDAMEGPTPVSALIHAATMVAAGVFLMARIFPLLHAGGNAQHPTFAAVVVTTIGAITALLGALLALSQMDIKRILAYSTVSQLGYMMLALGVGGLGASMLHLLTHGFFKALLFLGAGSVIYASHHEQDIRSMGGLKKLRKTFATFAVGMMALSGVPVFFCGFWSKEAILHSASEWHFSQIPFFIAAFSAFLTAFYMTRLMLYVFFGHPRATHVETEELHAPHESPSVMTSPLIILATCTVLLALFCTPAWPWLQSFVASEPVRFSLTHLTDGWRLFVISIVIVSAGIGSAWLIYAPRLYELADRDPLQETLGVFYLWFQKRLFFDELYEATFIRFTRAAATVSNGMDRWIWGGVVKITSLFTVGLAWMGRFVDEQSIRKSFDAGCESFRLAGGFCSRLQSGNIVRYLRIITVSIFLIALILILKGLS